MDKRVPEVRFKGFSDDWEQRKAIDIFDPISEKNHQDLSVLSVTQDNGILKRSDLNIDIKYSHSTLKNYKLVKPNNFVISLRSFQGGFEKSNVTGIVSPAYTIFSISNYNLHDPMFWSIQFKTYKFIQSLKTITFGIRDGKSISFSEFKTLKLKFPSSKLEQIKIGKINKKINETIVLYQNQLFLYREIKKSLLQKMFPKDGEKGPEVRFADFHDDWEHHKLGDFVDLINGRAYKQEELLYSGKYPVLRVGNFNTNNRWYYSNLKLPEKNYANKGDLLYTWATAFGPHIWNGPQVIFHYHIWKMIPDSFLNTEFLLQFLIADKNHIVNNLNGSTMVHITKKNMENKNLIVPSTGEQRNISKLMKKLDSTTSLYQQQLELYKTIKKYYLQKLFI